jgi:HK97 family phage portal protein
VSLFRRERRQWAPEPIIPPFPGMSLGGSDPTTDQALQVSAVWACVRLIADSVSMMPLHAFTLAEGLRVPINDPPFVVRPSSDATMPEWIYMLMVSLLLRGNAYGRTVRRDTAGYPVQIELMNPDRVRCDLDPQTGSLRYVYNGTVLVNEDVVHTRAFRMPGSEKGLSPIQYSARMINTDSAVAEFAYGYFRDGAHPSAVLSTDLMMNQTQADNTKARFVAAIKGREPAVLSGGMKYTAVQVSPEESQFLATQKYGVAGIARIFGVPPEMIAAEAGNSMTYANVEQRGLDFLTYTLQPWLTRLEAAMAQLLPGNKHLRFDTSVLTRTDFETRMRATAIGIASKQMTPDESRALADKAPLTQEQKDLLGLVPLTVSPTGRPLTVPTPPAPQGEPA